MRELSNERKINRKHRKELERVLKCDCMKYVYVCEEEIMYHQGSALV